MSVKLKHERIDVALGKQEADLVIKNGNIINVFTKEILQGDIAIYKDLIVGIGNYAGKREIDATGKFICPGLIDSHLHIESSMVTPVEFAKAILPHGTTTIIADPHEIANVSGINGIMFMLNSTKELPLNAYVMIPSCVPATPFENNGAHLNPEFMEPLKTFDRILGLGEVMDYNAILEGDETMLKKIDLFDYSIIDGHSPALTGKALNAYRTSGISTDHECSTVEEALERLRLGMYVQIREGSAAKNLETLVTGLMQKGVSFDRCVFCTDDKHLEDIRRDGHISYNIKKAIALGLDPIEAVCMATRNAAQCYKLKRLGAVAPGYSADLIILNDLKTFDISKVYYRGRLVADPKLTADIPNIVEDKNVFNTVRVTDLTLEDLAIKLDDEATTVIRVLPHELITKKEKARVGVENGLFSADENYSKLAVIERHKALNNIGKGIVCGFNIRNGAIASTVAHDSHNLIVIGDNDEDMLLAIKEIKRVNGGYTVVSGRQVVDTLELPIAGLMSDQPAEYVEGKLKVMLDKAYALGVNKDIDPFITLSFLALPVIPEIRVTDLGLFDVKEFKFISQ
ncbi:MAG: adenine deaminase [Clostridia bacterium]|nr:adenine deaminase [Clostridia bacterium]